MTQPQASEVIAPRVTQQFADWIREEAARTASEDGGGILAGNQLENILTATTFDEIMDADMQGTHETRDLVGLEIEIHDTPWRVAQSAEKYDSALGVYIQFQATALTDKPDRGITVGQDLLISTGAPLIIGKYRSLAANGFLPARVRIVGIDTPNGTVLKLGKIPSRPVQPVQG